MTSLDKITLTTTSPIRVFPGMPGTNYVPLLGLHADPDSIAARASNGFEQILHRRFYVPSEIAYKMSAYDPNLKVEESDKGLVSIRRPREAIGVVVGFEGSDFWVKLGDGRVVGAILSPAVKESLRQNPDSKIERGDKVSCRWVSRTDDKLGGTGISQIVRHGLGKDCTTAGDLVRNEKRFPNSTIKMRLESIANMIDARSDLTTTSRTHKDSNVLKEFRLLVQLLTKPNPLVAWVDKQIAKGGMSDEQLELLMAAGYGRAAVIWREIAKSEYEHLDGDHTDTVKILHEINGEENVGNTDEAPHATLLSGSFQALAEGINASQGEQSKELGVIDDVALTMMLTIDYLRKEGARTNFKPPNIWSELGRGDEEKIGEDFKIYAKWLSDKDRQTKYHPSMEKTKQSFITAAHLLNSTPDLVDTIRAYAGAVLQTHMWDPHDAAQIFAKDLYTALREALAAEDSVIEAMGKIANAVVHAHPEHFSEELRKKALDHLLSHLGKPVGGEPSKEAGHADKSFEAVVKSLGGHLTNFPNLFVSRRVVVKGLRNARKVLKAEWVYLEKVVTRLDQLEGHPTIKLDSAPLVLSLQ